MQANLLFVALFSVFLTLARAYPADISLGFDSSYDEDEEYALETEENDDDRTSSNRAPKSAIITGNEIDSLGDDYSTAWGASSVEGVFIKKALEEEDGIGVSFEEITKLQQEFGRRLAKSARPKLIGLEISPRQNQNQIVRRPSSTTTSTTVRTIPTTTTTTTTTTTAPPVPVRREPGTLRPLLFFQSSTTTTAPQPAVASTSSPVVQPGSSTPESVESRKLPEPKETSTGDAEDTTESFLDIQKSSENAKESLGERKVEETKPVVEQDSLRVLPQNFGSRKDEVIPTTIRAIEDPTTVASILLNDAGELASPFVERIAVDRVDEVTTLDTLTADAIVTTPKQQSSVPSTDTPALSSAPETSAPKTDDSAAVDTVRRIPGRRTSVKKFRLASSTPKTETVERRPVNVTIRRRPVNRKVEEVVVKQDVVEGETTDSTDAPVTSTTTLRTTTARVELTSPKNAAESTKPSQAPVQPGVFGLRIRRIRQ